MLGKIGQSFICCLLPFLALAQATTAIGTVQGIGNRSPLIGETVQLQASIVTGLGSARFYAQSPIGAEDDNPNTSEGILIRGFVTPRPRVGDLVEVSGTVLEVDGMTAIGDPGLSVRVLSENNPLPAPLPFTNSFPARSGSPLPDLERVEGMRIRLEGTVSGPSNGNDLFAVRPGLQRSFREPGIVFPGLAGLPVWDGNPERFFVDPGGLGLPDNRFVAAGGSVELTGILAQIDERYVALPSQLELEAVEAVRPVRSARADEITVASINVLLLDRDRSNYERRLRKMARYLTESLGRPDIIALQEIGGSEELQDLQFQLELINPGIQYDRFFLESNDNIHTAFLARADLGSMTVTQLGKSERFTTGGRLHNRPPLLLTVRLAADPQIPLQILNLHVRSLDGSEDEDADFVFEKRHEQAKSIARMVESLRDDNLLVVGDYNAFPFSDGFADVVGQICGLAGLGAQLPVEPIVSPPLRLLTAEIADAEQYSFVFRGDAQLLDHAAANDWQNMQLSELVFARGNADAPISNLTNDLILERSSDHDGFVVYLQLDALTATKHPLPEADVLVAVSNPAQVGSSLRIEHQLNQVSGQWVNAHGQVQAAFAVGPGRHQLSVPNGLTAGWYVLLLRDEAGRTRDIPVVIQP